MCKEPRINLIVRTSENKKIYLFDQHIRSLEEIKDLIRRLKLLRENTILLEDDGQVLNPQHLESARSTGYLNITLTDSISEIHKVNLKNAFNVDYVDNNNMVEKFLDSLNCKHRTWKYCKWGHIPYNTIFQSSGYGKSRLVKEVAKRIPTIYLCLGNTNSGYPLRTSVGADLFEQVLGGLKKNEEWRFLYVLQIAIQCFKEELTKCNNNEEFWNNQMDTGFCKRIWTKVQTESINWKTIFYDNVIRPANFLTDNVKNDDV